MDTSSSSISGHRPWSQRADEELLCAWKAGSQAAGEALFERHYGRVALFFHNKVAEPEELIQRTFLAAVEATERFELGANFRAYLLGIAVNVLRGHYRQLAGPRNHAALEQSNIEDRSRSPSELIAMWEGERRLLEALRRLPLDLQILLELFYWERLKTHELAQVLQWPLGTVRDRLRRARRQLEEHLRALDRSKRRLDATQTRIEDWARAVREQVRSRRRHKN